MKIGGREVVGSGSLVTGPGDNELEIVHGGLTFKLFFLKGEGNGTVTGEVEGATLRLTLSSFDNALGISWHSQVGTIDGKALYLAIYVWAVGEGDNVQRAINYTFSKEVG